MPRLALATAAHHPELGGEAALLVPALLAADIAAEVVAWDDPGVDWAGFDGVAVRSTWDYPARLQEFRDWAEMVSGLVPLANPAEVIRWNSDKAYLTDLSDAGIEIVPTMFIGPGTGASIDDFESLRSLPDLVVKPTVSAGAMLSGRFASDQHDAAQRLADEIHSLGLEVMVQPYIPSVDDQGEADVVVFGGTPSHAVAKGGVLVAGAEPVVDYSLAEDQWHRPIPLTDELAAFAADVVRAVHEVVPAAVDLLQARVDSVLDPWGTRCLMEVELVEPFLFLATAPDPLAASQRYATAAATWLASATRP